MHKKEPLKKISLWLPIHWLAMLDDRARAESTTRTAIIKANLIDLCLRRTKGTSK